MSESLRMWIEVVFNVSYLCVVWLLVVMMMRRRDRLPVRTAVYARPFMWAFALLALGDTGHVGFRVVAYALGDLDVQINLLGKPFSLVGLGTLLTAVTVTFFYMLVLVVWKRRFDKSYGWWGLWLFGAAVIRLVVMVFPQNDWNSTVTPWPWSLYRNIPLLIQGLGVAYLILRDASAARDRTFTWVGIMILVSYAFYTPVILFARQVPILGTLMIPKTLAYVAIAWLVYTNWFTVSVPAVPTQVGK